MFWHYDSMWKCLWSRWYWRESMRMSRHRYRTYNTTGYHSKRQIRSLQAVPYLEEETGTDRRRHTGRVRRSTVSYLPVPVFFRLALLLPVSPVHSTWQGEPTHPVAIKISWTRWSVMIVWLSHYYQQFIGLFCTFNTEKNTNATGAKCSYIYYTPWIEFWIRATWQNLPWKITDLALIWQWGRTQVPLLII